MQEAFAAKNPVNQLKIINTAECELQFTSGTESFNVTSIANHNVFVTPENFINTKDFTQNFKVTGDCVKETLITLQTNSTQIMFLYKNGVDLKHTLKPIITSKRVIGISEIKFIGMNINNFADLYGQISTKGEIKNFTLEQVNNDKIINNVSYTEIDYDKYNFNIIKNVAGQPVLLSGEILLETCGRYSVILFKSINDSTKLDYAFTTDIVPNGLSIYFQLIQITVMSLGEGFNKLNFF